jgi:hypothetical protein
MTNLGKSETGNLFSVVFTVTNSKKYVPGKEYGGLSAVC